MPKLYDQNCPIARTLDLLGDRWTLLVIRDLFLGQHKFSELLASSPGMPPKILSDRLKRLEEYGLVQREIYNEYPPRAEYKLTKKGRSLLPVLESIGEWGVKHLYEGDPGGKKIERYIKSQVAAAKEQDREE
jgi:DNA-binding HxlR family transcriptional regulator